MKTINLVSEANSPCCLPTPCDSKPRGPILYISKNDEEVKFPKEGTAVVKFRKVGSSESHRDGEERYSCDLEITEITVISSKKASGGEALDKLKAEKESEYEDED